MHFFPMMRDIQVEIEINPQNKQCGKSKYTKGLNESFLFIFS